MNVISLIILMSEDKWAYILNNKPVTGRQRPLSGFIITG